MRDANSYRAARKRAAKEFGANDWKETPFRKTAIRKPQPNRPGKAWPMKGEHEGLELELSENQAGKFKVKQ